MKLSEGVVRQRRNLIIISGVLVMLKFGKVEITKLSVASIEFNFGNPEAMYIALWAMYIYFFIRYIQYVVEDSWDEVTRLYLKWMDRITVRFITEMAQKLFMEGPHIQSGVQTYGVSRPIPRITPIKFSTLERRDDHMYGTAFRKSFLPGEQMEVPVVIYNKAFFKYKCASIALMLIIETALTELLFPGIFALAAGIYAGSGGWPGAELF